MSQIPIKLFCRAYCNGILSSPITDQDIDSWHQDWKPHFLQCRKDGNPQPDESWDWEQILQLSQRDGGGRTWAITSGDATQGLMWVTKAYSPQIKRPKSWWNIFHAIHLAHVSNHQDPILLVERIATAPWNRGQPRGSYQPQYKLVGETLLREAVVASFQMETEGRIGLYALPGAESFYEKVGMSSVAIPGNAGLKYFEFSTKSAKSFL